MIQRLVTFLVLLFGVSAYAQTTTLTGGVVDSDSIPWAYAQWTANLVNPSGQKPVLINGTAVPLQYHGLLTATGTFNGFAEVTDNTLIYPQGTAWTFTVCPNVSGSCQTTGQTTISGPSFNAGSFISSQITAPRFQASNMVYAYTSAEILNPFQGSGFINSNTGTCYIWNGVWMTACGSPPAAVISSNMLSSGTAWTALPSSGVWTASGTTISANGSGSASCTIQPTSALPIAYGTTYQITLTASISSGAAYLSIGDNGDAGRFYIVNGTNTFTYTAASTNNLVFYCGASGAQSFTLSGISVQSLTGGTWNIQNGLNITGGQLHMAGSNTNPLAMFGSGSVPETGVVAVAQPIWNEPGGSHGFIDASIFYGLTGNAGYGAFDCITTAVGPIDHSNCFQARPTLNTTVVNGNPISFQSQPTIATGAVVGNYYHFFAQDPAGDLSHFSNQTGYGCSFMTVGYCFASYGNHGSQIAPRPNYFGGDTIGNGDGPSGGTAFEAYTNGVIKFWNAANSANLALTYNSSGTLYLNGSGLCLTSTLGCAYTQISGTNLATGGTNLYPGPSVSITNPSGNVVTIGVKLTGYTVANLPTCNAAAAGLVYAATDATSPTYLGALTGGGSVYAPVVCNGTAWRSY